MSGAQFSIADSYEEVDTKTFKNRIVELGDPIYTFGTKVDLEEHLSVLAQEFSGKSYLEYFHAATIVFIRRKINLDFCLKNFFKMWDEEGDFLRSNLDSRWLVSACDTIIDHSTDPVDVATAISCVLLMNTVKLYETERVFSAKPSFVEHCPAENTGRVNLFDGMSIFTIGRGDMVKKMLHRVNANSNSTISSLVLKELLVRLNKSDTVYKRFRELHTREATKW